MDENHSPASDDDSGPIQPKKSPLSIVFKVLAIMAILALLICMLLPTVRSARPAADRNACQNNLKQIALALRLYEETHHALPPAYTTSADGKPLHSWRTLILPFLEEQKLYESIDLTKPWDDPANAEARKTIVPAYQCPAAPDERGNQTTYLAVLTPNSCLRPTEGRSLAEITDGAAKTVMLIEVDSEHAVPWMAPMDADEKVVMGIGASSKMDHPGGVSAAFVDGHVQFFFNETSEAQRRALISIAGNDEAAAKEVE